jgi:hypothetical protein
MRSCPFMVNFSSSELWMEFSTLSRGFLLRWNCESKLIKSHLGTSRFELWQFIAWASPSDVVFWYCAFLLKSLKLDGIASPHSSFTIPYALWLHHIISINTQVHLSLEQECRYPIPTWVYPWKSHRYYLFPLFSTRGLYIWILNCVGITFEPPWTLSNHLVNLPAPWLSKRHLIVSPPLIGSTRPIVTSISSSLFIRDP